jgi:hypothetical protein
MSPAAVLDVYQSINKQTPPPCFLLSIKAEKFELGEGLSTQAENNLDQACLFAGQLLQNPDLIAWQQQANNAWRYTEPFGLARCPNETFY